MVSCQAGPRPATSRTAAARGTDRLSSS